MKKVSLATVFSLIFVFAINAQDKKIEAKINPFGALFGRPELSGEYLFSPNFGAELTFSIAFGTAGTSVSVANFNSEKPTQSGFGFKIGGKYYFNPKNGGDGWYLGIYFRQESLNFKYTNTFSTSDYKSYIIAGGLDFGKKWAFNSGFLIETGIGIGRPFSEKREFTNSNSVYNLSIELGFDFTGKFAIGYRF